MRYWKLACDTGSEPLLPREVAFIHKDVLDEDEEQDEDEGNGMCRVYIASASAHV